MTSTRYADRRSAGRELAEHLRAYAGRPDVVVLGLPRGGMPVAAEVAKALGAPLDVFLVRKLGVPGHEELAMGAIASGGVRVLNERVVDVSGVTQEEIETVAAREATELVRRESLYRSDSAPVDVTGKTVIVVDDGLATGATMRAAVLALRQRGADSIVVAVPTAAPQTCAALEPEVDELVCPSRPDPFGAVGFWYRDFSPTTDEEVREVLEHASRVSEPPRGGTVETGPAGPAVG